MGTLLLTFRRFFLSGAAAALLNFVAYYIFITHVGFNYLLSGVFAFLTAFICAFLMHRYWSFAQSRELSSHRQLLLYLLVSLGNLVCIEALLYLLVEFVRVPPIVAYVVAAGSVTMVSFAINNFFVFAKTSQDQSKIWRLALTALGISVSIFTLHAFLFVPVISSDTTTYIETAQYYAGEAGEAPGFRLLKPLAPLLLAGIHLITGTEYLGSFWLLVFVSYLGLALAATFFFYVYFRGSPQPVLAGVVLTLAAYPVVKYGLDPITEVGALTFVFASSVFVVLYHRNRSLGFLLAALALILTGFFWKEYTALTGVALLMLVLLGTYASRGQKMLHLALTVCIPFLVLGLWHMATSMLYGYTYMDWLVVGQASDPGRHFTLYYILKSLAATLLIGWVLVLAGVFRYRALANVQKKEFWIFVMVAPMALLWGYVSSRLFFPALIPALILGAVGSLFVRERWGEAAYAAILILYVLASFVWSYVGGEYGTLLGN